MRLSTRNWESKRATVGWGHPHARLCLPKYLNNSDFQCKATWSRCPSLPSPVPWPTTLPISLQIIPTVWARSWASHCQKRANKKVRVSSELSRLLIPNVFAQKKTTPKNNNGIFVWIGVCPCLGLSYAEHCGNTRGVRDQSRKAKKARQNFREERRTKNKVTWLKCLINQRYI